MDTAFKAIIIRVDDMLSSFIKYLLIFFLLVLVLAAFLAMLFRQLNITNMWLDPLARHLVMVTVFLGAGQAITMDGHIRIDIVSRMLQNKPRLQFALNQLCHLFAALVCVWLSIACYDFFLEEREYPKDAFLGMESYHLILILPIGMWLVATKMFTAFFSNFFRPRPTE